MNSTTLFLDTVHTEVKYCLISSNAKPVTINITMVTVHGVLPGCQVGVCQAHSEQMREAEAAGTQRVLQQQPQ